MARLQGAIVTMTKCLAKELVKSRGIRVNSGLSLAAAQGVVTSVHCIGHSLAAHAEQLYPSCEEDCQLFSESTAADRSTLSGCAVAPGPVWTPLIAESFPAEKVRFCPCIAVCP